MRAAIPAIDAHTAKLASVHGERHPEMATVHSLFRRVATELQHHMAKEEQILFPLIRRLARAKARHEAFKRSHSLIPRTE